VGDARSTAPRERLGPLAASTAIALVHLRRRIRDRSALLQGIVAPVVLAAIIASAFGGGGTTSTTIGVVDLDDGTIATALTDSLEVADEGEAEPEPAARIEVVALADRAAARVAIDEGDVAAAIVVPEGFGESLGGTPRDLEVIADEGQQLGGDVADAIAARLAASIDASRLAVRTVVTADPSTAADPGIDELAARAAAIEPPVALGASAFGDGFDPIAYFAPSMAILFAFLTLGAGARALLVERREGTLARIRSTPVSDRSILAGVTASVVVVGLASFLIVWLVTAAVFGATWGQPAVVLAVIVATVVAIAGISTLVTGLARTEAQADGLSSVVAFGFALVGGGFLSPGDLPEVLRRVALLTPNRWALDAFAELGAGATGLATVAPSLLVLTAIGVTTGAAGLRLVRLGDG
jgi:ABC-2 type transport system permease protein